MSDDKIDWGEFPQIRKVGRYLFFGLCAIGPGVVVYGGLRALGINADLAGNANFVAMMITFLALRDMSAAWDRQLIEAAKARKGAAAVAPIAA